MATVYKVSCESGDHYVELTLKDSPNILPTSDSWEVSDPTEWGAASGVIASWGEDGLNLYSPDQGIGVVAVLQGFTKKTSRGDHGHGEKELEDGQFPPGGFEWSCTRKE